MSGLAALLEGLLEDVFIQGAPAERGLGLGGLGDPPGDSGGHRIVVC